MSQAYKRLLKVGEEAVETIPEAQATNDQAMIYETSDLVYHLLVLLQAKGLSWSDVVNQLIAKQAMPVEIHSLTLIRSWKFIGTGIREKD